MNASEEVPEPSSGNASTNSLFDLLVGNPELSEFLTEFTVVLCHDLAGEGIQSRGAITLLQERRRVTVAFSDPKALFLDELQYRYPDGPCLEAARTQSLVHVPDTSREQRLPGYMPAVVSYGIGSVLAVPLKMAGEAKLSFNAFADQPHTFDERALTTIQDRFRETTTALHLAVRMSDLRESETNLSAALQSRTTIDLAVGIVMGQNHCSQNEAFRILASAASNRNIKLRELAQDLVVKTGKAPATAHFDR